MLEYKVGRIVSITSHLTLFSSGEPHKMEIQSPSTTQGTPTEDLGQYWRWQYNWRWPTSWSQLAWPHLFTRSKWHTTERNLSVGDIVLVADQNALRGQFRLGRVVKTNPDSKGIVRDANVKVLPSTCVPGMKADVDKPTSDHQSKCSSGLKETLQSIILH